MKKLMRFFKDEDGATAIEYGLIAALIAAVIIVSVQFAGNATSNTFSEVGSAIDQAGS